jgi:hypothetical protein
MDTGRILKPGLWMGREEKMRMQVASQWLQLQFGRQKRLRTATVINNTHPRVFIFVRGLGSTKAWTKHSAENFNVRFCNSGYVILQYTKFKLNSFEPY